MKKFGISYLADNNNEFIMKVTCDDVETAIKLVAEIKQLSEDIIIKLFNIEEIRA